MSESDNLSQDAMAKAWVDAWQHQAASFLHKPETLRFLFGWLESMAHATPASAPFPPVPSEPGRDELARVMQRITELERRIASLEAAAGSRAERSKTKTARPRKGA